MDLVSAVSFPNQQQRMLRGILHQPDPAVARGVCILLLSPGTKGRVGPHRLYRKIAARLVPLGFHVLRFDYHGLGDSDGEISDHVLVDMYNSIMGGRYVGDTVAAMDWMASSHGITRFVGSGLCGGSISALLTAAVDKRIECLLMLGIPTVLDGGAENWSRFLTQGRLHDLRRGYLGKLTDLQSWRRLLSGKSSYSVIWKALRGRGTALQAPASEGSQGVTDNVNPKFAPAFFLVVESGRPILLVFSEADRLHHDFEEKFQLRNFDRAKTVIHRYQVHVIDGANHVLSNRASIEEFLNLGVIWLGARYPSRPQVS